MKTIFSTLIILFVHNITHAKIQPDSSGKVYTYKEAQGIKRELEVFFPKDHTKAKEPVPAILFFHGGGWSGGSREYFNYQCDYFAKRGIVAATVSYRLADKKSKAESTSNKSHKRICVPDAKSAIRWFKQNADELGIDPKRIILAGGSAGAHVGLIATNNPNLNAPNDSKGINTSVVAYVLFNPALSVEDSRDKEIDFIQHLRPTTAPAIVFFGSKDKWLKGWNPAYKKWQSLKGTSVKLKIIDGQGHGFFNRKPWIDLTLLEADNFLTKQGLLVKKDPQEQPENDHKKLN